MVTSETCDHPTPNGGIRSVIYYLNSDGKPAEKDAATQAEIVELGEDGEVVHRTYAQFEQSGE